MSDKMKKEFYMLSKIQNEIISRQKILEEISDTLQSYIYTASIILKETIGKGNSIYLFGNGENILNIDNLVLNINDKDKIALSLCENISSITKIANNFGFDRVFDVQIEPLVRPEDLLIGFSVSGNSKNVLRALSLGRNLGCKTIGFSGYDGGAMSEFCDLNLIVPSDDEKIIREMHLVVGNIICKNSKT